MGLISSIRFRINKYSNFWKSYIEEKRLKKTFSDRNGMLGQSSRLLNPKYIKIGQCVRIKEGYRIECYDNFHGQILNPQLIFEDGVIVGPRFTGFIADKVVIKRDTIFAGNVTLISENHGNDPESTLPYHAQPLTTGPITIGEGCWLGQNVCVLPNVTIGDKCIIGTNSVVTKDIPSYSIAVGSPARVIKQYNFEEHKWQSLTK